MQLPTGIFYKPGVKANVLLSDRRPPRADDIPNTPALASNVRSAPDVAAMTATQAAVLLWNYVDAADPASASPTTVTVHGLPTDVRRVLLTHCRNDDRHSNAYTAWEEMSSPQRPAPEQCTKLQRRQRLELMDFPVSFDVVNGKAKVSTTMPRGSVSLMQLAW